MPYVDTLDKNDNHHYIQSMTSAALLLKEVETMSEAAAAQVLDFAMYIKGRHIQAKPYHGIAIKDAHGIFKELKGIDTTIER